MPVIFLKKKDKSRLGRLLVAINNSRHLFSLHEENIQSAGTVSCRQSR